MAFVQSKSLSRHMRVHIVHTTFECKECDQVFRSKRQYQNHIKLHAPPVQCKVCLEYVSASKINRHESRHRQVKTDPVKCPCCPKMFNVHGTMLKHLQNKHPQC